MGKSDLEPKVTLASLRPGEFDERAWLHERWRIFHALVPGFFVFVAMVLGLILWVADSPDAHREHEAVSSEQQLAHAPHWPDGSLREQPLQQADVGRAQ